MIFSRRGPGLVSPRSLYTPDSMTRAERADQVNSRMCRPYPLAAGIGQSFSRLRSARRAATAALRWRGPFRGIVFGLRVQRLWLLLGGQPEQRHWRNVKSHSAGHRLYKLPEKWPTIEDSVDIFEGVQFGLRWLIPFVQAVGQAKATRDSNHWALLGKPACRLAFDTEADRESGAGTGKRQNLRRKSKTEGERLGRLRKLLLYRALTLQEPNTLDLSVPLKRSGSLHGCAVLA